MPQAMDECRSQPENQRESGSQGEVLDSDRNDPPTIKPVAAELKQIFRSMEDQKTLIQKLDQKITKGLDDTKSLITKEGVNKR